ncbi:MAG: hypothetical protein F7B20_02365 [Aeropyrum sp.]|nr:hypothetical protein [Aeropyrum sp.]MCE4615797.1 hypothetical protein [Aeropyrum sp.]
MASRRRRAPRSRPGKVGLRPKKVRLGRVKAIVRTGHVLVEPENERSVEAVFKHGRLRVVADDGPVIGYVSDVIGRVDNPYIVVRAKGKNLESSLEVQQELLALIPPHRPRHRPRRKTSRRRRR